MLSITEIKRGLFSYEEASSGFVASFKNPADLLRAAENTKQAKVKSFDCFTPCPIHGLDDAMGLHRSWIPVLTFIGGMLAGLLGVAYMYFIDAINWPIVYGGKPFFAWPSYVPVLFELAIYFAAVFTVVAVLVLGKLGNINRKLPAAGVTSDMFAIWLGDANLTKSDVERILAGLPAEIQEIKP